MICTEYDIGYGVTGRVVCGVFVAAVRPSLERVLKEEFEIPQKWRILEP